MALLLEIKLGLSLRDTDPHYEVWLMIAAERQGVCLEGLSLAQSDRRLLVCQC